MSMRRPHRPTPLPSPSTNIPSTTFDLIGRTIAIAHLWDLLSAYRVVSLVGPGGIGKTALALQCARSPPTGFEADRLLVELASLSNPGLVSSAVAGVLGIKLEGEDISAGIHRARDRSPAPRFLSSTIASTSSMPWPNLTETVVSRCPNTTIIATSREALRIDGEHVYRVPALGVPPEPRLAPDAVLRAHRCRAVHDQGEGAGFEFRARRGKSRRGCRHLPAAGRHSARDRVCRGARGDARSTEDRGTAGRQVQIPHNGPANGAAATADAPRDTRLELRSAPGAPRRGFCGSSAYSLGIFFSMR